MDKQERGSSQFAFTLSNSPNIMSLCHVQWESQGLAYCPFASYEFYGTKVTWHYKQHVMLRLSIKTSATGWAGPSDLRLHANFQCTGQVLCYLKWLCCSKNSFSFWIASAKSTLSMMSLWPRHLTIMYPFFRWTRWFRTISTTSGSVPMSTKSGFVRMPVK